MDIDTKEVLDSRKGREFQIYVEGRRQVVGCIPYRLVKCDMCSSPMHKCNELQVLLVSSQKCQDMMFPKGGWELDETMEQAAKRETLEEAGVIGELQELLGCWPFKSKSQDTFHNGFMFPLLVEKQLNQWSEKDSRQRKWVKVCEVMEVCPYLWMKEALEILENRLRHSTRICTSSDHNIS